MFNKELFVSKVVKDKDPFKHVVSVSEFSYDDDAIFYGVGNGAGFIDDVRISNIDVLDGLYISRIASGEKLILDFSGTVETEDFSLFSVYLYRPDTGYLCTCTIDPSNTNAAGIPEIRDTSYSTFFTVDDVGKDIDIYLWQPYPPDREVFPHITRPITLTKVLLPNSSTDSSILSEGVAYIRYAAEGIKYVGNTTFQHTYHVLPKIKKYKESEYDVYFSCAPTRCFGVFNLENLEIYPEYSKLLLTTPPKYMSELPIETISMVKFKLIDLNKPASLCVSFRED